MADIMYYHRLVEKDSRHVRYCWKFSILFVLIVAVASGLVISFSLYSLWDSFGLNCFMGADLSFVVSPEGSNLVQLVDAIHSTNNSHGLRQFLQSISGEDKYTIHKYNTKWNNPDFCEYLVYTPLFHALVGVIWMAIFQIHGHGGQDVGSIISRPWSIIFPSLVFFIVCGISAFVCASLTTSGLAEFCQQFNKILSTGEAECARMISYFSTTQANNLILPDKNYYLVAVFPWIWASSYVGGAVILVLRITLVVDFQLIRVVVSLVEWDKKLDTESIESEKQQHVHILNEKPQGSSEPQ